LATRADGFLFENVPSITHPRSRTILEALVGCAQSAKYETLLLRVNAVQYGVPQCRHRIMLLGLRQDKPTPPMPMHSESSERSPYTLPAVTGGEALSRYQHPKYAEPDEVVTGRWADQLREILPDQNYKALTAWAGYPKPAFEAETRFWHFLLKLSPDLPSWTVPANRGDGHSCVLRTLCRLRRIRNRFAAVGRRKVTREA
jgi:DNA (cytosine-5)-methyltransferase 1